MLKVKVLIVMLFLAQISSANECFVSGTVVDKNIRPLVGASIFAHSPPTGWEDLIVSVRSIESGGFYVDLPCKSSSSTLFVTPPLDFEKNFIPLRPPFSLPDQKHRGLAGIKLPKLKKGTFNVGTVGVSDYFKTEIEFVDKSGNPFLPGTIDSNLWFRIRPVGGSWIKLGGTSNRDRENAKLNNRSVLKMTLPEGKWIIELNLTSGDGAWFYPDQIVYLSGTPTGTVPKLRLTMSRKKTLK